MAFEDIFWSSVQGNIKGIIVGLIIVLVILLIGIGYILSKPTPKP